MKKSQKISFSSLLVALAVTVMLVSYFPYLTYAVPAIAGFFIFVIYMEVGNTYAVGGYVAAGFISLLFAEKEAAVMFLCLFGIYPIIKALVEKIKKQTAEWVIKLLFFNVMAVISYYITVYILGIPFDDFGKFSKYGVYVLWAVCNPVFVLYDISLSKMAVTYIMRVHPTVARIFKR